MKVIKKLKLYILTVLVGCTFFSCTNLDEVPYDKIVSENFYQTKDDIIRSFLRTYEHGYWSIQSPIYRMQELSADQLMTPNREGHWADGGTYSRMHKHTWTPTDGYLNEGWEALFVGIGLANNSIEDFETLDPARFGLTSSELNLFIAELRVMRAWYYIKALDLYGNVPIVTKFKGASANPPQATPAEVFAFIEKELTEAMPGLGVKGDPSITANRWTKAGAAALLCRLYLNGEIYTGHSYYDKCAAIGNDIINGKYSSYAIEDRWDAPFDWNNDLSSETLFAFPGSFGRTHWHYEGGMYWWTMPFNAPEYLEFDDKGTANPRFAMQPGRDVDDNLYNFPSGLGQPFVKFQNYADDVRLGVYKNLGDNKRTGMFLYGYLDYGNGKRVQSDKGKDLYIRDAVGWFGTLGPGQYPADKESNMLHADQNSGVYYLKYPFYKSTDSHKMESDYAEIRLAEIYYSVAECKFRAGDVAGAEQLINTVRKRYYPAGSPSLYNGELTEKELLDEWGREFLGEGRRRTDLIRFNKFTTGVWWDKDADASDHTKLYPIGTEILNASPQLKQNPGYN
jgi:hypothetical protein